MQQRKNSDDTGKNVNIITGNKEDYGNDGGNDPLFDLSNNDDLPGANSSAGVALDSDTKLKTE